MKKISIIEAVKTDKKWDGTPLKDFFKHIEINPGYMGRSENLSKPCYFCSYAPIYAKNTNEIKREFWTGSKGINEEFKIHMYIRDYLWFNAFLSSAKIIYNSKAFECDLFVIKYIRNISYENIYAQIDDECIYLTFFNNDLSQLFTIYVNKVEKRDAIYYEYKDVDDTHIDVCRINQHFDSYIFNNEEKKFSLTPAFQNTSFERTITEGECGINETDNFNWITYRYNYGETVSRKIIVINGKYWFFDRTLGQNIHNRYDMIDSAFFFKNLQKIFKAKNIQKMQDISDLDFWESCRILGLSNYISPKSGANRTLKHKIIIINKLLGYDRFNEEKFSLKQLHLNKVKNDYYFTNKLSLSKILEFNFITEDERKYLENIKISLSGDTTISWKNKEVDLLFDKNTAEVRFGSIAEAAKLIGNKTEYQIKDKFKRLYIAMCNKTHNSMPYYFRRRFEHMGIKGIVMTDQQAEELLNKKMEDYRKSMTI